MGDFKWLPKGYFFAWFRRYLEDLIQKVTKMRCIVLGGGKKQEKRFFFPVPPPISLVQVAKSSNLKKLEAPLEIRQRTLRIFF